MNAKDKEGAEKEKRSPSRGIFKPVSNLLCKLGFGDDDCKYEMAMDGFIKKYRIFCRLQKTAAHALSLLPRQDEGPGPDIPKTLKTVSRGANRVVVGLEKFLEHDMQPVMDDWDKTADPDMRLFFAEQGDVAARWAGLKKKIRSLDGFRQGGPDPHLLFAFQVLISSLLRVARQQMFSLCTGLDVGEKIPRQLVAEVPMQYWVIDLDGAVQDGDGGKKVPLDSIACSPMHALWEGLTAEPWSGPPPVNAKGFLSVMFQCTRDPCMDPGVVKPFAKKNYVFVSKQFCNLTSRLGFHYTTAEGFLGEQIEENYAAFEFKGGAACIDRRERRVRLIAKILETFGFTSDVNGDRLFSLIDAREAGYVLECLKVLGYLMTHTRQLDMAMCSDASVDWYYQEFMGKMAPFIQLATAAVA